LIEGHFMPGNILIQKQSSEREAMPGERPRQREQKVAGVAQGGSSVLIAGAVVLSLLAAWTLFAYSGGLDSAIGQKDQQGKSVPTVSFSSNSPSKEYIYAGGRLLATEEPAGGCTPPPASVLTTSVVNSVISLNWTVTAGVDTFDVERSSKVSSPFAPVATNLPANTTTWQDLSVGFGGVGVDGTNNVVTYVYRIIAHAGQCSMSSNLDWATNISFTEGLIQQQTLVKAHHITELRVAVNSVWKAANQNPETITWSEPSSGTAAGLAGFQVKKIHVDELRSKLNQAMDAIQPGYSSQHPYSDATLVQFSTPVRAIHLVDLRNRVK
jgi:hypothetical protein